MLFDDWSQFSLRSLFVLTTLACVWLAVLLATLRRLPPGSGLSAAIGLSAPAILLFAAYHARHEAKACCAFLALAAITTLAFVVALPSVWL